MIKSNPNSKDKNTIDWAELQDSICRYDLDELDVLWLQQLNYERERMGKFIQCMQQLRASASEAVDFSLIPSRVKPLTMKFVFTSSVFDAQH